MRIEFLAEDDLKSFSISYMKYFNDEGDDWTQEIAYKRLHQMWYIDDSICLKAVNDNQICGILMGYLEWFDDGPYFHIFEILVLREYQASGIGTSLIREAERIAKARGAKVSTLEALNDDQHERFYGRMGYKTKENFVYKVKKL